MHACMTRHRDGCANYSVHLEGQLHEMFAFVCLQSVRDHIAAVQLACMMLRLHLEHRQQL